MARARRVGALFAIAALALGGCVTTTDGTGAGGQPSSGSTSSAPNPAGPALPDPCDLLSQDEAEALAGTPLNGPVEASANGVPTTCQYSGPSTGPAAQVQVLVGPGVENALKIDRDELQHAFSQPAGIGDEAWLEDNSIFIRKGTLWAQLNLVLLNEPTENTERLLAAAAIMVSRM